MNGKPTEDGGNLEQSLATGQTPVTPPQVDTGSAKRAVETLLNPRKFIIKIDEVAADVGLQKEKVTLPNGREVMQITWRPEHLQQVFMACEKKRKDLEMGKSDLVVIDGVCPTWLLPAISHAFHPTSTSVNYPQGGPDATLPVSGASIEGDGAGKDLKFKVMESNAFTTVEFELAAPQIDAKATVQSLVAPQVPFGKSVRISGRGPIAIAAVLAEAYAHKVPAVSCFQPGVGFVTCISHDEKQPIGSVSKE